MSTDTENETEPEEPTAATDEVEEVEELDAETRARRDAALRAVRKLGDPVLRATALPVERFDEALRTEVLRMDELMQAALGVGLAATQVGILHRLLVYRAYPEDPTTALVNPVLEWVSEELEAAEEGCLSIPGVHVEVERPARVRVRALDPRGAELLIDAEGLEARVIQHEIDHLDGVLILDRISREARRDAMRALREARRAPAPQPAVGARSDAAGGARERVAAAGSRAGRAPPRSGGPDLAHGLSRHLRVRGDRPGASGGRPAPPVAGDHASRSPQRTRTPAHLAAGRGGGARALELVWSSRSGSTTLRRWPRSSGTTGTRRRGEPVLVVCAFGALIREPLLSAHALLNVHPSLLPRWRGAAPIERAIMAGDAETGVSIMRLTAGLDSGPVCLAAAEEIAPARRLRLAGGALAELRR